MTITITGRKVALKESFKERVEKKLKKFDRFFDDEAQANVTVTLEKNRQTVEVTIKSSGMIFRAEETQFLMEDALDKVTDALVRQIRKNKTKLEKRLRENAFDAINMADEVAEEADYKVVKAKKFPVKPLDVEEAILQMNMLGHEFFIFRNATTGEINVVYRRQDGNYGIIEPDVE